MSVILYSLKETYTSFLTELSFVSLEFMFLIKGPFPHR